MSLFRSQHSRRTLQVKHSSSTQHSRTIIIQYTSTMKTFDDLVFHPHSASPELGVQAGLTFDNGYAISVVGNTDGGSSFYGNHPDTFEVAVFNQRGDFVPLQTCDDVLGWQNRMQVSKLMSQFQQDGVQHEKLLHSIRQDFNEELTKK